MKYGLQKSPGFDQITKAKLRQMADLASDAITAEFADVLLSHMPIEDGHAHESFVTALRKLGGKYPNTQLVASSHVSNGSGDATAQRYSYGEVGRSAESQVTRFGTLLPFVRKMEYGYRIRVGDMEGRKGPKVRSDGGHLLHPPGTLYGDREPGNTGLLVWREGGIEFKARTRTPSGTATGFFARAKEAARKTAKELGLQRKK